MPAMRKPHNCSVFIEYNTLTELMPDCEKTCPQCTKAFLVVSGVGKPLKKRPRGGTGAHTEVQSSRY